MGTPLILVHLDDNPIDRRLIKRKLTKTSDHPDFVVDSYSEIDPFLNRIKKQPLPDILLLDIDLKNDGTNGLHLAKQCRAILPKAIIILLSNYEGARVIQESLAAGADDYYYKRSISDDFAQKVLSTFHSATYKRGLLQGGLTRLKAQPYRPLPSFVGHTLEDLQWSLAQQMQNSIPNNILISGGKGTGKELVSQIIEAYQPLNVPFIRANCEYFDADKVYSIIFGIGSSDTSPDGLLNAANGGWLYLANIETIPVSAQKALLNVIKNKGYRKVGSTVSISCSVNLLCSTEHDLLYLVKQGQFLADFYEVIAGVHIKLPDLASRRDELVELIYFRCKTEGGPYSIDQPAIELLTKHDWKTANIDELFSVIDAMKRQSLSKHLTVLSLPKSYLAKLDVQPNTPTSTLQPTIELQGTGLAFLQNDSISVRRLPNGNFNYSQYCDLLFLELIRLIAKEHSQSEEAPNLYTLEKQLAISRQTISSKIRHLYSKKLISKLEFTQWIKRKTTSKKTKQSDTI